MKFGPNGPKNPGQKKETSWTVAKRMDVKFLLIKGGCERRGKKKKAELKIQCNTKTNTDATRLGSNGIC